MIPNYLGGDNTARGGDEAIGDNRFLSLFVQNVLHHLQVTRCRTPEKCQMKNILS